MDFIRAFTYIFEDREWVGKLAIIAVLTFTIVFVPLGFMALAMLMGYGLELIVNVRERHPQPLPRWDDYSGKLARGLNVLAAWFVYNIPNILMLGCTLTFSGSFRGNLLGSAIAFGLVCCLVPFVLIYNLLTWPMLALGTLRYTETQQISEFFRFGELLSALRFHRYTVFQWIVLCFLINLLMGVLIVIPCLGWLALLGLLVPVQGHLLGQFAQQIDAATPKRKR